jgi:hypothetical protein
MCDGGGLPFIVLYQQYSMAIKEGAALGDFFLVFHLFSNTGFYDHTVEKVRGGK